MSAMHTPGPWRLNAGDETVLMSVGGYYVARACCGGTTGIKMPEAEANARLIAAAPDLLVALQGLAKLAWNDGYTLSQPEVGAAEYAIAKATGQ